MKGRSGFHSSWAVKAPRAARWCKRGPRVSTASRRVEKRIRARRRVAASVAALYPGADHANGADRRVQSPSFGGAAALPLVAVESRSAAVQRADDDAGVDR